MKPVLTNPQAIAERIIQGGALIVAGSEAALRQLPRGSWIGGTIPYSMNDPHKSYGNGEIFATDLSSVVTGVEIRIHDKDSLRGLYSEAPENGFTVILIPVESPTHMSFALNSPLYPGFATRPLVGWIAGGTIEPHEVSQAKVIDGRTGELYEDAAVVLHAWLPPELYADVGIVNVFEPGGGDVISFERDGFTHVDALINGKKCDFASYIKKTNADLSLPLVADYQGAMVNSSFQSVDESSGEVRMFAPLFRGISYHLAKPIGDYGKVFAERLAEVHEAQASVVFTCNCILNYVFAKSAREAMSPQPGPATAGEIAYQLLNQTMVYVTINRR
jgi:hypothetical protein